MFELQGKHSSAKVFTDVVDERSISQIINMLNQPFTEGAQIRMMPDVHAGAGCCVGTTMTLQDKVCPSMVGVDIGCGMEVAVLEEPSFDPAVLDAVIREKIPAGFSKRTSAHQYFKNTHLSDLRCKSHVNFAKAEISFGTLGGGNHFIEAGKDEDGRIYLVIHSGSRHLGIEVEKFYRRKAVAQLQAVDEESVRIYVQQLRAEGKEKEISSILPVYYKEMSQKTIIPELAYVSGYLFENYIHDMRIVQEYALWSRRAMMDEILRGMSFHAADRFATIHNYIDTEALILRKGAVSAKTGETLIIPINMKEGSLLCRGKGNPDWNFSAPHGAGRLMSRAEAKASFTVEQFQEEMEGIYSTSVGSSTLDEAPMAYKSMKDIVDNIGETVDILHIIRPVYNFKASEQDEEIRGVK